MDHMSRTHICPSTVPVMGAKGQATQRPTEKITPFHSSPIVDSGRLHSKRPEIASGKHLASPGILFFGKTGHLATSVVSKSATAFTAAAPLSSGNQTPVLCLEPATKQGGPLAKHLSKTLSKSSLTVHSKSEPPSNTECSCSQKVTDKVKPHLAVKRKKRKMGLYNLVPKKKAKALKQHEKAGGPYELVRVPF